MIQRTTIHLSRTLILLKQISEEGRNTGQLAAIQLEICVSNLYYHVSVEFVEAPRTSSSLPMPQEAPATRAFFCWMTCRGQERSSVLVLSGMICQVLNLSLSIIPSSYSPCDLHALRCVGWLGCHGGKQHGNAKVTL